MNPADPSPAPQNSGPSKMTIAGIGCLVLVFIGLFAVTVVFRSCVKSVKQAASNPTKFTAEMMVKANPNLELVKSDEGKGEMTIRDKKTGETTTMSFDDISKGKFTVKNSKGETVSVDNSATGGGGKIVMNGPDGSTVIGGDAAATQPPEWVPAYPAAQARTGGMKHEDKDQVAGTYMTQTKDTPIQVRDFFDGKLKDAGFQTSVNTINSDGSDAVVISATNENPKRKITIAANTEKGTTNLVISYEGAK